MKNLECKIVGKIVLIAFIICSYSLFSAASYDVGIEFQGEIRANPSEKEEDTDPDDTFVDGGSSLDTLDVKFSGSIDNVDAFVQVSGKSLDFDKARVTVNDLFDGILTVAFFTVENERGKDDLILPDKNFYGGTVKVKPIDILTIELSYAIGDIDFINVFSGGTTIATNASGNVTTATAKASDLANLNGALIDDFLADSGTSRSGTGSLSEIHNIIFGVDLSMDVISLGFYASIWIFDDAPNWIKADVSKAEYTAAVASGSLDDVVEETPIALVNLGLSIDALKFFGAGILKVEFGTAITGAYTRDLFRSSAAVLDDEYKTKNDFNFVIAVYGGVGNIAETGFGISYYFHYTPDNPTKDQTLGDLDLKDSFDKTIAFHITPAYTIGQFTIGLGLQFELQGQEVNYQWWRLGDQAGSLSKDYDGGELTEDDLTSRFEIEVEPAVTWAPNDGMSFRLYYEYVNYDVGGTTNLSDTAKDKNEVGLDVKLKLFVDGAFQEIDSENQNQ